MVEKMFIIQVVQNLQCDWLLSVHYLTNRFHFCVRLYCNRLQMTSSRVKNKKVRTRRSRVPVCSSHAMASSGIYYSTEAHKNEIYLFYIIIQLAKIMRRPAK